MVHQRGHRKNQEPPNETARQTFLENQARFDRFTQADLVGHSRDTIRSNNHRAFPMQPENRDIRLKNLSTLTEPEILEANARLRNAPGRISWALSFGFGKLARV